MADTAASTSLRRCANTVSSSSERKKRMKEIADGQLSGRGIPVRTLQLERFQLDRLWTSRCDAPHAALTSR